MVFEDLHRPLGRAGFRGATAWIIAISGILLILQQFLGGPLVYFFGLAPARVWQDHWWWQVATYQFLHGGIFHWFFNMFILWMFGRELEIRWGTAYFVKFFFVTGLGAALCILLLSPRSLVPTIGSSGAVFGLLVAFAMLYPHATMYLYLVIPVKAWQAVALFAFIEFFAGLEGGGGSGIARFAHIGGMLTGYIYLKFGWRTWLRVGSPLKKSGQALLKKRSPSSKRPIELREVTNDLIQEVDTILDKILKQGVESLTSHEKEIMERYSKLKR